MSPCDSARNGSTRQVLTVREVTWVVRDGLSLIGVFARKEDADRHANDMRIDRGIHRDDDPRGWLVRVEPWQIVPPSHPPSHYKAVEQQRALLDHVQREWGLLNIPAMGTGHFFLLDTYLVVPRNNRLTCPAFQFDHERSLWPGFREALQALRAEAWDEFSILGWFASPQGAADGAVPAHLIRSEPERVLHAVDVTVRG